MLHKQIILIVFSFFLIQRGVSQENDKHNLGLTLDIAGNSGFYSLNVEHKIFMISDSKINGRVGVGYLPANNNDFLSIPLGLNLLTGKKSHHLELGIGFSYIKGVSYYKIEYEDGDVYYYSDEALYFVPSIGYRFDRLVGGFIFKVYYSPLILTHDLFNQETFIKELVPDEIVGEATLTEYLYIEDFYPKAENHFGNFGFSIGYRF